MKFLKFSVARSGRQPRALALTLAGLLVLAGANARLVVPHVAAAQQPQQEDAKGQSEPNKALTGRGPRQTGPAASKSGPAEALAAQRAGDFAPTVTNCANKVAITFNPTGPNTLVNGTIGDLNDCSFAGFGYDEYTFNATAGQQVFVQMVAQNTTSLDPYIYLLQPNETTPTEVSFQNDDILQALNQPNLNARLPAPGGVITLPTTGQYSIIATAGNLSAAAGNYTVTLGTLPVTTITNGQTRTGTLQSGDAQLALDGTFYDTYSFTGQIGQQVAISMSGTSGTVDPFLFLIGPDGEELASDNNGGGGTAARIPQTTGFARLPATGTYIILANTVTTTQTGNYSLTLSVSATVCPLTPIAYGQTINAALETTDCRLAFDGSFIDAYSFNATAGQNVAIAMNAGINSILFLLAPNGTQIRVDDNGGGGTNSRIPEGAGFTSLPVSGTYTIIANSVDVGATGGYTLTLTTNAVCTYTLAQTSASVPAGGGNFSVGFTTQPSCAAPAVTSNAAFLTLPNPATTINPDGTGTVNYTVAANSGAARAGTLTIGGQTFTVNQDTPTACPYNISPTLRPFNAAGGSGVVTVVPVGTSNCAWTATADVPWLMISAGSSGAGTGRVRYNVAANTGSTTRTGHIFAAGQTHTVTQTASATTPTVQFNATTLSVREDNLLPGTTRTYAARVTVTRTGDTSASATVDYATVDDPAAVPCNPNDTTQRGTAYARCDYATTIDTLTFQPGETSKTFDVPLVNDVHVEGNETFRLTLSNAQGATIGTPATLTVTIQDDDTIAPTTNPVNQTPFFVRQQYLDFLSREPEAGEPWSNVLNNCANPFNVDPNSPSANCDRLTVSAAFFGSPEFQLKGTFVFLAHKAAFGSPMTPNYYPTYEDFAADLRRVTGTTPAETFAKRFDFAEEFVTRPAFNARYMSLTNAQYVDTLLANINITLTNPDPQSGVTRTSLVNDLNAGTKTRADVLRLVAESQEGQQRQFNFAFVATQYYGYLRRTPDAGGYQGWLTYLTANPSDFRTMVNGFMNSREYRFRFGPDTLQ